MRLSILFNQPMGQDSARVSLGMPNAENGVSHHFLYGLKAFTMVEGKLKEHKKENAPLLKLGKYKEGGGCLYINKLSDINIKELEKIIRLAVPSKK